MGNTFDEQASTWDERPDRKKRVDDVWNLLKEQLNFEDIKDVLDYGSGTGMLGYKMIDLVESITFCDTSKPMLDQVEKKRDAKSYKNVKTLWSDFTADQLPKVSYDLIISMLVLHHVEAIERLISAFHTLLNKGGKFAWIDLDKEDGSFHNFDEQIPHLGFSKARLEELMNKQGFTVKFYSDALTIQKDIDGEFRDYALFVMVAEKR